MQPDEFFILIEPISEVEAKDVVDFKKSKIVAKLSAKQYEDLVKANQLKYGYNRPLPKKLGRPAKQTNPLSHQKKYQAVSQSKSAQAKFRLPLIKPIRRLEQTPGTKPLPRATPDNKQQLPKPVSTAPESSAAPAPKSVVKTQKLIDLIPPDVDVFGLNMEQLYLNTPETDESDCDSVSYFGSDDSY